MNMTLEDVARTHSAGLPEYYTRDGRTARGSWPEAAALCRTAQAVIDAAAKARQARWVQPVNYDKHADYNADMELGEALAAHNQQEQKS